MTKADIINELAENTGLQKREVAIVVENFMEAIKNSLLNKKENVYLRRFWKFHHQAQSSQDSPQHSEEHHYHDCSSRLTQLQACQEFCREDERGVRLLTNHFRKSDYTLLYNI